MKKLGLTLLLSVTLTTTSFAEPPCSLVPAETIISNLSKVMAEVQNKSKITVLFPKEVPVPKETKLYANASSTNYEHEWTINITNKSDCQTKSCLVGTLSATKDSKIEKDYVVPPFNKPTHLKKEKVMLTKDITGYYTPAHAEADWHPAQIEWIVQDVHYQLSWNICKDEKILLMKMAGG